MDSCKYDFFISHTTDGGGRYIALELQSSLSYFGLSAYVAAFEGLMVRDEDYLDKRMAECRSFIAVTTTSYVDRLNENINDPNNWIAYEFRRGMSGFLPDGQRGIFILGLGDWSNYTLIKRIQDSAVAREFPNNKFTSGARRAFWILPPNKSLSEGISQMLHLARARQETRNFFTAIRNNNSNSAGMDHGSQAILYFSSLINPQQAFAQYFKEFFSQFSHNNLSTLQGMIQHTQYQPNTPPEGHKSAENRRIQFLQQKYLYASTTGASAYASLFVNNTTQGMDTLSHFLESVYLRSSGYYADEEIVLYETERFPKENKKIGDEYSGHDTYLRLCMECLSQAMKASLNVVTLGAGVGLREATLLRDMLALAWRTAIQVGPKESFAQLQGRMRYIFSDISMNLVSESYNRTKAIWSLAETPPYLIDFLRTNKPDPSSTPTFDEAQKCEALNELRETLAQIDITSCFASFRDIHNLQSFLRRSHNARNLFLLLGNTYNVMSQEERNDFIRNLHAVSECGDYLLVELNLKAGNATKTTMKPLLNTHEGTLFEHQRELHEFLLSFSAGRPSWEENGTTYYIETEYTNEGKGVYRYPVFDNEERLHELWYAKIRKRKLGEKTEADGDAPIYFPIATHPTGWTKSQLNITESTNTTGNTYPSADKVFRDHAHDLLASKVWRLESVIRTYKSDTTDATTLAIGIFRRLP